MTITPQVYQDGDSLLRDEILISNDAGTTWRRAYSGLISSPVTISAWSNSWQVVSIGDTQMPGSALDAGRFNPGSAPSFDIFLLTESSNFSTVSLRLWDTITGSQASMFAGLVQLVYRGQLASGTGALTSGSGVTIWQGSEASTASIPVAGFANQVHKFELTFLGYPPSLPALSLGFELSINRTVYSIDLADDWAEGSLWLNPDKQFLWPPLKPTTTGGNVTVERFAIAGSGVALLNSGPITRTLANGTHWLSMSPTGEVSLASTVPAGNYPVAKAIVSGNVLTRVFPACTFRASRLVGPAGAGLVPYRFINFSNGLLVPSAGTTGSTVRVSTNSTGAHVTSGFALVEAGEAILVGSNIQANSNGKAINESGIGLGVALSEAYADGDLILVQLITASEGGGAITAGEVRNALETLTGTNRLDASAIQNLPSMPTGTQIRDALAGLTGTNRLNASAIFGITTALEALTGNDRLDASAIKNLPGEPSGMQVRLALESLSSELRLNASAIQGLPEAPTGAQIRDALAGLTGVNRLDASAIKNLPSAPTALSQLTNDTNFTTLAGVASVGYLTSVPDNSVTTAKVQDGAITNAKLASGIDAAKITTGTIPSARLDTGTTANKIVQLDGSGRLPALDGSQLTNLPSGGAPIAVQNEGTPLTSGVTGFNFIGEGVTASNSGGLVTVNIPGGGVGGAASSNLPIETLQNNNSVSLAFSSVGDTNGLFHYLGRRENTQAFANPVTDGRVVRISGSLDNTNFAKLFDKSTGNDPLLDGGGSSNTVTFELIGGSMSVNRIALFSNSFTAWTITFSGSNDGTNWTTVVQDWQVGGGFNWKTNTTILSSTAYRYWRISHSAGGSPWLAEIEFYGSFFPSTVTTINLVPNQAGKVLVNSLYSNNYQLTIGTNNDFVSGWFCYLRNNTTSLITLNPLAGVTISTDGALTLAQNELALLVCTSSNSWVFQKLSGSNKKFVNASANDFQLFSGNHLLSSGFTAKLPQSPTEMDFVYVNTIKSPQTLVTNQTNVDGLLDGVWTITLSQQPHPIPVWFQGSKWNTHIPFISSFTLDPAVGVNLSTFTSHSSPSGIFDYLGRNNGTSQTYTNPIDGAIISATSTGHLDVRSPNKIADRLRTGNDGIYHGSNSSSPEWMQIQFLGGRSVMLKQLSIRASQQHSINRFVLAGSNNGTNWTNIWDSGADILSSNDVLSPANLTSVYYTYFRFTELAGGFSHFCIGEVELYGILKLS